MSPVSDSYETRVCFASETRVFFASETRVFFASETRIFFSCFDGRVPFFRLVS